MDQRNTPDSKLPFQRTHDDLKATSPSKAEILHDLNEHLHVHAERMRLLSRAEEGLVSESFSPHSGLHNSPGGDRKERFSPLYPFCYHNNFFFKFWFDKIINYVCKTYHVIFYFLFNFTADLQKTIMCKKMQSPKSPCLQQGRSEEKKREKRERKMSVLLRDVTSWEQQLWWFTL